MQFHNFILLTLVLINFDSCRLEFISRAGWGAQKPKYALKQIPANRPYVFIHHTYLPKACYNKNSCIEAVKSIQNSHRNKGWGDIGYSFLIGQDGNVYEGRGWGKEGAHTKNYNSKGYAICFIGDFTKGLPNSKSLQQAKDLISEGIRKGFISKTYKLRGHKDVGSTSCPGQTLYDHIKKWPQYK